MEFCLYKAPCRSISNVIWILSPATDTICQLDLTVRGQCCLILSPNCKFIMITYKTCIFSKSEISALKEYLDLANIGHRSSSLVAASSSCIYIWADYVHRTS